MRGVPGRGPCIAGRARAVVVTQHRGALVSAGPVVAGHVPEASARRHRGAVEPRAGQDVVMVRLLGAILDRLAALVDGRVLVDVVAGRVQVLDVPRDAHALGVVPGALADAVARMDDTLVAELDALRAQVGTPVALAGSRRRGELLAVGVRAGEPAEIAALAGIRAGQEERHLLRAAVLLCLAACASQQRQRARRGCQGPSGRAVHVLLQLVSEIPIPANSEAGGLYSGRR